MDLSVILRISCFTLSSLSLRFDQLSSHHLNYDMATKVKVSSLNDDIQNTQHASQSTGWSNSSSDASTSYSIISDSDKPWRFYTNYTKEHCVDSEIKKVRDQMTMDLLGIDTVFDLSQDHPIREDIQPSHSIANSLNLTTQSIN